MGRKILLTIFSILLVFSSVMSFSFAHSSDGPDSTSSKILPFHYFAEGSYIQAILILVFWILIIKGLYELTMLTLAMAIK